MRHNSQYCVLAKARAHRLRNEMKPNDVSLSIEQAAMIPWRLLLLKDNRYIGGNTMKTINRLLMLLIFVILLTCTACGQSAAGPTATPEPTATPAPTIPPGDSTRTLVVGDLERNYLLHIPPGLDSQRPVPVVFVFHGLSMLADDLPTMTGFNDVADTGGFLAVYPNGYSRSWNVSVCCGAAVNEAIDDLAFVR